VGLALSNGFTELSPLSICEINRCAMTSSNFFAGSSNVVNSYAINNSNPFDVV
jgi:hypothetical protein